MRRHRGLGAALVVAATLAAGATACVSTDEVGGSNNATPTTTTLPPEAGAFGDDVTYGGVVATVIEVRPFDQSPNGFPRISVVMRAENVSDTVQHNPDLDLICNESAKTGDWYLGSTWEPNAVLPVNAVTQGQVIVGFPTKSDNPEYPVVACSAPKLRLTVSGVRSAVPRVVLIPVDDSVIAEALRRPRGPSLPLPPSGT